MRATLLPHGDLEAFFNQGMEDTIAELREKSNPRSVSAGTTLHLGSTAPQSSLFPRIRNCEIPAIPGIFTEDQPEDSATEQVKQE